MRFVLAVLLFGFSSVAYGQSFCPACDVAPITVTMAAPVQTVAVPSFDVDCAIRIGQEFLECTEDATTRRQRFRCAFRAIINNADCLLETSSTRRAVFRVKQRMQARRLAFR